MRTTRAVVDLDRLAANYRNICSFASPGAQVMCMVKSNAYGHGIAEAAARLEKEGAKWMGVAIPEEGELLRKAGVRADILVLGAQLPESADLSVAHRLTQTVCSAGQIMALEQAALRLGIDARAHVKVETGMNRIGVRPGAELDGLINAFKACPNVRFEGMFSHLARAEDDQRETKGQFGRFLSAAEQVHAAKYRPMLHIANSAAMVLYPEMHLHMVRPGILLYGYPQTPGGEGPDVRPVMELRSRIVFLKEVRPGEGIGYGAIYRAKEKRSVATVPVGYGDGYSRALSGVGMALVGGVRVPIVGRVCMDQIMLDVTGVPGVTVGDGVVLMGRQSGGEINAASIAEWTHTISYEVLTGIGQRVPRVYQQ